MTETREAAQRRRAEARQQRREDAERIAQEGEAEGERTSTEQTDGAGNGAREKATGALGAAGQRLNSKTVAAAAAVGASVGAATLAGKKLLSARRKGGSDKADESEQ